RERLGRSRRRFEIHPLPRNRVERKDAHLVAGWNAAADRGIEWRRGQRGNVEYLKVGRSRTKGCQLQRIIARNSRCEVDAVAGRPVDKVIGWIPVGIEQANGGGLCRIQPVELELLAG